MTDPIQEQYRDTMNAVAEALDEIFNGEKRGADRETGFVLLVFPYGQKDGQRCNYISNGADRRDMAAMFKEVMARWQGQPKPPEGHA
jgi:hypothetical protein